MQFTDQQKHDAALREAKLRRRLYPRWVADGRLTQGEADMQIAVMEAIAADYAPPDLFNAVAA